jgi:predicted RNase H-like nuclease (RuvC/YqgF family)
MSEVIALTIEELSALIVKIFKSIKDDLIFPIETRSMEEQVVSKVRNQRSMIINQEDQICSQTRVIQAQAREIAGLNDLLARKDKEIERLNQRIKSLELSQF